MPKQKRARVPIAESVNRLGGAMDLPPQMLPGFSHVELWQNRRAVVEGVKGVLSYSESCVQLNLGTLVATFRGAGLCIQSYQMEQLTLTGTIAELGFSS